MNENFFHDAVLLSTKTAEKLYNEVKDLPIIDCHCHLDIDEIRTDHRFENLGELWLAHDHYKWRAMRLCGVEEEYITGDRDFHEKYLQYAKIFPMLAGSPLYYWTQLELKNLFGIVLPLNEKNAEIIWEKANGQMDTLTARGILKKMKVTYLATTNDPTDDLIYHGKFDDTVVAPTFRPDRFLNMDEEAFAQLSMQTGIEFDTVDDLKKALSLRLANFVKKGCKITDHGMDFLPVADVGEEIANIIFQNRWSITPVEKKQFASHLLTYLCSEYKKYDLVMQWHFGTYRNVNEEMFAKCGADSGFDIMRGTIDTDALTEFFKALSKKKILPRSVLYPLNDQCLRSLCTLSGAFPDIRIGAAWWFNDTLNGIRRQLETVSEYAVLGTQLGMLTDSRSLASYVRFDFYRRILADYLGNLVEKGEYDEDGAYIIMKKLCGENAVDFLKIGEIL